VADRKLAARARRAARLHKRGHKRRTAIEHVTILGHTYRRSPHPTSPPTPAMQRLLNDEPATPDEAAAGMIDAIAIVLVADAPATPTPRELLENAWEGQRLSLPRLWALYRAIAPPAAARRP
jgi:hypothetical protein